MPKPGLMQLKIPFVDSKTKHCQDLSTQLAIYRSFRNSHAAAAVLRQMAHEQCPVELLNR